MDRGDIEEHDAHWKTHNVYVKTFWRQWVAKSTRLGQAIVLASGLDGICLSTC